MSLLSTVEIEGEHDRRLARSVTGVLGALNRAGLLTAADVHLARTLARVTREQDVAAVLAAALAARAVRTGSVAVDLGAVLEDLPPELVDLSALPGPSEGTTFSWPDPEDWTERVSGSKLVAQGALVVEDGLVYLQRYHHQETQVVDDLRRRADLAPPEVVEETLGAGLARIFPGDSWAEQRAAAELAVRSRTSVITGGPGTGKTTTVAGVLSLLVEQEHARGEGRPLRIGLAAPTGKAAARVQAAVAEALTTILERTEEPELRAAIARIGEIEATTLHRLLGWRPGSRTRFRHHRGNRLPYDVVLVDEASMVSLTQMARLLEALRPEARLILVGDADQLVSVDAGAVLADLVASAEGERREPGTAGSAPVALARLRTVHRFGATIAGLAEGLRTGDADAVLSALRAGDAEVTWLPETDRETLTSHLRPLLTRHARRTMEAAVDGDVDAALASLEAHRLLCAHREGPFGVRTWNRATETWLVEEVGLNPYDPVYPGRPLLVTANDYGTGVLNGDTGVIVTSRTPEGVPVRMAVVEGAGGRHRFAPGRLGDVETMHAMTIHKSQGSQAEEITVLLPDEDSPLLTRELFYTAVTRARSRVRVIGSEEVVRAAVERRVRRASGLRARLTGAR